MSLCLRHAHGEVEGTFWGRWLYDAMLLHPPLFSVCLVKVGILYWTRNCRLTIASDFVALVTGLLVPKTTAPVLQTLLGLLCPWSQ